MKTIGPVSTAICRICFSTDAPNDVSDVTTNTGQSYEKIFSFCLDIQVTEKLKMRKLCTECFNKILTYFDFKTLALKNDAFLNSEVKLENPLVHEEFINEPILKSDEEEDKDNVKLEPIELSENEYEVEYLNWQFEDFETILETEQENENCGDIGEDEQNVENEPLDTLQGDEVLIRALHLDELSNNKNKSKDVKIKRKLKTAANHGRSKSKSKAARKREFCEECGLSVLNLESHKQRFHGESYSICDICNKTVTNVKRHRLRVHFKHQLPYGCDQCDKRYPYRSALKEHVQISHDKVRYECEVCHVSYVFKKSWIEHRWQLHGIPNTDLVTPRYKTDQVCPDCGMTVRNMEMHIKRTHLMMRPECDICHKAVHNIKKHKITVHHKELMKFCCKLCERKFVDQYNLDRHMDRVHNKQSPQYPCDICNKYFSSKDSRSAHQRYHNKEKVICHMCSKSFASETALRIHIMSHTDERPYRCDECGKAFRYKRDVTRHMSLHTGVRMFHCELCGKSSSDSSNHRKHMRVHEADRPVKKTKKQGIPLNKLRIRRTNDPFMGS